jgi:hypothetical protein
MEAHATVCGHTGRGVRIVAGLCQLHAISEAPPTLACVASAGDAGAQEGGCEQGEERFVSGEGIVIPVGAGLEQAMEATSRTGEHARHVVAARWRQGEEARGCRISYGVGVGAIESQGVEVDVQVESGAEALEEGHCAALFGAEAPVPPNAPAQLGEERSQERAKDLARETGVVGAAVAQWVGEGEDPLPDRHLWENAIDEVRGGVGHAAAAAGGAETTAFAGERHEPIVPTSVAVQAQEAVGEDAAAEEGAELLLDETRRRPIAVSGAGEEGLELLANGAVQGGLIRRSGVHGAAKRLRGRCPLRRRSGGFAKALRVPRFTS